MAQHRAILTMANQ